MITIMEGKPDEHREGREKAPAEKPSPKEMKIMDVATMTVRHQNWMWAVRRLMGWPAFKPACDSIAFTSGRPMDFEIGMECGRLAAAMRKDLVYSSWASAMASEPETYSVVIRELLTVDIVDRCLPFMADDAASLILVSTRADEIFAIGSRGLLERRSGKPKALGAGRKLATKHVRALAATMGDELATNNQWVPIGGQWVEPEQPADIAIRFN